MKFNSVYIHVGLEWSDYPIDFTSTPLHTEDMLHLGFKRKGRNGVSEPANLMELKRGEEGVLDRIELPEDISRRLMELGFLPGHVITPGRSAPGGEPRVYRVDGSEVALRRETAAKLMLRRNAAHTNLPDLIA
jgi:ferrous iron transport protein A